MAQRIDIWERLSDPEDGLTERKPEAAGERDFKETLVAFANSVPDGSEGVLFVGVGDKPGEILGCKGIESLQKTITRLCANECYPPVQHTCEASNIDGKAVLAVIVPYSANRPHFAGHAFRRVGAQNIKADERAYLDFIASRSSVGARVLENRGKVVQVRSYGKRIGDPRPQAPSYSEGGKFLLEVCDPHAVTLQDITSGKRVIEQLENFSVSYEASGELLFLVRNVR
jgi:hypothetical protein